MGRAPEAGLKEGRQSTLSQIQRISGNKPDNHVEYRHLQALAALKYRFSPDWWAKLDITVPGIYILTGFPGRRGNAEQMDFHLYPLTFADYVKLLDVDPSTET